MATGGCHCVIDDLARDVRYAIRTLLRHPGFAAAAMLSLALGIGANAAIFSLVDQVLLRLLPVKEPERLVLLDWKGNALASSWGTTNLMSYPFCRDLQQQTELFDGVFCRHPTSANISTGGHHERASAEIVSGSYFSVLGVRAEAGRLISSSDDLEPGAHPVIVLSHDYWQRQLAGAPDVIGRKVLVNNYPMTVIGIAAAGFRGVDPIESPAFWVPAMMKRVVTPEWDRLIDRRTVWMNVFARLKAGSTAEQAKAKLQPWFTTLLESESRHESFPQVAAEQRREFFASTIDVLPAPQGKSDVRGNLRRPLWVLMTGTLLLLLLACLNVASLLLARGAARAQEVTTRMALGASKGRIAAQLVVEGLLIALAGGLLGLAAAPAVSRALMAFLPDNAELTSRVDQRVFLFAFSASVVTGVLCGLAPAVQAGRVALISSLKERSPTIRGGAVPVRKAIVIAQLAFTLVLLVGAGLFLQTLARLQAKDRGFDDGRVLTFSADALALRQSTDEAARVMRDLLRALQALPEVERAALANTSLLTGGSFSRDLTIEATPRIITQRPVPGMRVSPGFFSTIGIPLVAGRDFEDHDTRNLEDGYRSVIVNESFARRYLAGRSAVGRRVGIGKQPTTETDIEIVGVVRDFSYRTLREDESPEHLFFPFADSGPLAGDGRFYLKLRTDSASAMRAVRATAARVDAALPLDEVRMLEDQIGRALRSERMLATLSSGFGTIALLLSVVGLYGVMSFVVTQRRQEIGVRVAIGATRAHAMWLVVREALIMIAAGTAIAVPVAWALRRLIEAQLFGVPAFDGPTVAAASGVLTLVTLGAAIVPAWRAALVPPMVAIRDQPESMWHTARVKVRQAMRELAAGREPAAPSVTLISEFADLVRRAASFPEAVHVALATLRERTGAQSIVLLERVTSGEYRGADFSIPARGILINRLQHYPHPLPLTRGDFQVWRRWAGEFRPEHAAEIEALEHSGARIAVPLRSKSEIVGVLLLAPADGHDSFSAAEKEVLSSAAELFALMIENARLNERALEQEKVRRDLALAAEVQRRLLPPQPPASSAVSLAAFTLPARVIGGDYYDFVDLPGKRIDITVADVAGKGIAAALLMSVVQASLRVISADEEVAPAAVAAKMNRYLYRSTATNRYATFFYAQLDVGGRRLRYVNAGHNPPYLVRQNAAGVEITELSTGGTALGLFPEVGYEHAEIDIRPGDLFVAFTDGVTEALDASGEEFGEERLKDLLRAALGLSAEEISVSLANRIQTWITGAEQHDDVTFVVATVK
jgi:predicted permease